MAVKSVPTLGWTRGNVATTIRLVTQDQRNEIAARIRAAMEDQGLSSVRLARKADVSDKTISRLINAERDPRYNTLERVAKALGTTEEELRGPPPPPLGLGAEVPTPVDQPSAETEERLQRIEGMLRAIASALEVSLTARASSDARQAAIQELRQAQQQNHGSDPQTEAA